MNFKKKYEDAKSKIAEHPNCIAAMGGMLIAAAACGYYSGKQLGVARKRANVLSSILDDLADGEKHAVWLTERKLFVQTAPLSEDDL